MVSKDLEEIELLKPKQSFPKKFIGIIFGLIALMFFLLSFVCFISIFGFFVGVGFMAIAICFAVAGSKLYSGDKKIKCPYCDDELTVSPEQKSIKCERCHKIILLKWLDDIAEKEAKLENIDNNSKILTDKHIYENVRPINRAKGSRFRISWILGLFFLFAGVGGILESAYLSGFLLIMCSAITIPYTNNMISEILNFEISGKRKYILIILIFFLFGLSMPETDISEDSVSNSGQSTEQTDNQNIPLSEQNGVESTLITKSTRDMLPTGEDIPTEFTMSEIGKEHPFYGNISRESHRISFDKNEGSSGYIEIIFTASKYNSTKNAQTVYNWEVDSIKDVRGYTELKSKVNAECFAYKIDEGFTAQFAENICIKENVVFSTYVTTADTFRTPDQYLNDMALIFEKRMG